MREVSLGIDVEPDCPPYLATQYRGIERGLPKLLDLLDAEGVATTCFCTGEVAERYPEQVRELVRRGHELGCHGHTHRRFDSMDEAEARTDLQRATMVLRALDPSVQSFRAPNLRFPRAFLPLLVEQGYRVDSSQAKYKAEYYRGPGRAPVCRIPASMTSSVLRLPAWLRDRWLLSLSSPVVLFVHPWEFVDLTRERLRLDCRFRTGDPALRALREVLLLFRSRGWQWRRMDQLADVRQALAA